MKTHIEMQDILLRLKILSHIQLLMRSLVCGILVFFLLFDMLYSNQKSRDEEDDSLPEKMRKYALMIIIDKYGELTDKDTLDPSNYFEIKIKEKLINYGYQEEDIFYLRNKNATSKKIKSTFTQLNKELKPEDSLFIYFIGTCSYDNRLGISNIFTYEFFENLQYNKIVQSENPYIVNESPSISAEYFGKWLKELRVKESFIVMDAYQSKYYVLGIKNALAGLTGNKSIHVLALNRDNLEYIEEIRNSRRSHECFINQLESEKVNEDAKVFAARIKDLLKDCFGEGAGYAIIEENFKSKMYKGEGFMFEKELEFEEIAFKYRFKEIINGIKNARSNRYMSKKKIEQFIENFRGIKKDMTEYCNKKKSSYIDNLCQIARTQIESLQNEIDQIKKIETEYASFDLKWKKTKKYKKLYLSLVELLKSQEIDSEELRSIESKLWEDLRNLFSEASTRLEKLLSNQSIQCWKKRKACKKFLSLYKDLKIADIVVERIKQQLKKYKCNCLELTLYNPTHMYFDDNDIYLYNSDYNNQSLTLSHDLLTGIFLFKKPLLITPFASYCWNTMEGTEGTNREVNLADYYSLGFTANKYLSFEIGLKLKYRFSHKKFDYFPFLGVSYIRNIFSIKEVENIIDHENLYFREIKNKGSFGFFTIFAGCNLMVGSSFGFSFGFPLLNRKATSIYDYEIHALSGNIIVKHMTLKFTRTAWFGIMIYF